jgi:hypothetical protein
MKHQIGRSLKPFLLELIVYAALVAVYYALVLRFLGDRLVHMYQHDRPLYSVLALGLIVGQGFLLEALTRLLLTWITPRREDG